MQHPNDAVAYWTSRQRDWKGSLLSPSEADAQVMFGSCQVKPSLMMVDSPRICILGDTPELLDPYLKIHAHVTVSDFKESISEYFGSPSRWPSTRGKVTFERENWLTAGEGTPTFHAIVGDGAINAIGSRDLKTLMSFCASRLLPGGRLAIRVFTQSRIVTRVLRNKGKGLPQNFLDIFSNRDMNGDSHVSAVYPDYPSVVYSFPTNAALMSEKFKGLKFCFYVQSVDSFPIFVWEKPLNSAH